MSEGKHRRTSRGLVATFVAVQIAVPAIMFGARWVAEGSHPEDEYPLSWQMYSAVDNGDFVGVGRDGSEIRLDVDELPAISRGVGYGESVARMFCSNDSSLVSVQRVGANPALESEDVTC